MADKRENPNAPMAFTDFDLSDKGRPAALVDENPAGFIKYPLHTITDLASSLDFGFEDDSDGDAPAAPKPSGGESGEQPPPEREKPDSATAIFTAEDQELALDDALKKDALQARLNSSVIGPPTWEDFTSAYSRARSIDPTAPVAVPAAPGNIPGNAKTPSFADTDSGIKADMEPDVDSDDFDVLSSLDAIAAPEDGDVGGRVTARIPRPIPLPPVTPYGGVERVEDWYAPPENQPDPDRFIQEDWFEPPEQSGVSRRFERDRPRRSDTIVHMLSDMDVDSVWDEKVKARDGSGGSRGGKDDTRQLDLFADLDLNSLWEEKLQHHDVHVDPNAPERKSGPPPQAAGETVIMEQSRLEAALGQADLDAAATTILPNGDFSRSKTRRIVRPGFETAADRPDSGLDKVDLLADLENFLDASETIEAKPEDDQAATDAWDAVDDEELDIDDYQASPRRSSSEPSRSGTGSADSTEGTSPDEFLQDSPEDGARGLTGEELEAFKRRRASMDAEIEAVERAAREAAMAAPAAAGPKRIARRPSKKGAKKPAAAAAPVDDEAEEGEENAAAPSLGEDNYDAFSDDAADAAAFDPAGAVDVEAEAFDSETGDEPSARPSGKPPGDGLSTDELMNGMDYFEDESVNSDIAAPVVDDSQIDMPSRRPRPGTEEMQAIMGEGEFAQDGGEGEGGAASPEPEVPSGPPADEVEVNPMDVFANMDDMDFSGDFDDDMKAMLDDEDEEGGGAALNIDVDGFTESRDEAEEEEAPKGFLGKAKRFALKAFFRVIPLRYVEKAQAMIAWHENWWFYCDLLAAIIASASLAVIISYYLWYRE